MKIMITNSKGGVGKSVSSIFAAELSSRMGKNTLIVDAGYQATTSNFFLDNDIAIRKDKNLLHALTGTIKPKDAIVQIRENLALIPGEINMADFADHIKIKDKDLIVKATLSTIFSKYENVIFDSESNLGSLTRNIFNVADVAVFPVYDGTSVIEARKTADNIAALSSSIKKMYVLPVMKRRFSRVFSEILNDAKNKLHDIEFLPPISYYNDLYKGDYNKAVYSGKAINEYKKSIGDLLK